MTEPWNPESPIETEDQRLARLRRRADRAESLLHEAVWRACPGNHTPIQHRDRLRPWCPVCGRDARGEMWHPPKDFSETPPSE